MVFRAYAALKNGQCQHEGSIWGLRIKAAEAAALKS